jgi:hypothetical protein
MKAEINDIKITMTFTDGEELKKQLQAMIHDIECQDEHLTGYFDEAKLRENYPKINELLNVINVRETLPF